MIKQISHIGVVVKKVDEAMHFYNSVLNLSASPPVEEGDIRVSMVSVGETRIELLEPIGSEGTLNKFLERRGEGVHHICFEVDNIDLELESLAAKGVELVDRKPRRGVEGKIAFLHPRSTYGVLIELVEKE